MDPQVYRAWLHLKQHLNECKKKELQLRNDIIKHLFNNHTSGTQHLDIDGYKITVRASETVSIDKGKENYIPAELLRVTYGVDKSVYNKLGADKRKALAPYLTVKPAQPQLEIKYED